MTKEQIVNDIYKAYGTDSGILFGIKERETVTAIVEFTLNRIDESVNHNETLTPTNKDWYNAGIMAQRILQNDEIETLKKKLKQEEFNHMNTRVSWDSTTEERDELKHRCKALEDRIKIITEKYNINV